MSPICSGIREFILSFTQQSSHLSPACLVWHLLFSCSLILSPVFPPPSWPSCIQAAIYQLHIPVSARLRCEPLPSCKPYRSSSQLSRKHSLAMCTEPSWPHCHALQYLAFPKFIRLFQTFRHILVPFHLPRNILPILYLYLLLVPQSLKVILPRKPS